MEHSQQFREIPDLPRDEKGPLFAEPWQLTAFGIVVALHEKGYFQWREWVNYISAEIELGKDYGVADHNSVYYHQWLAALEKLVTDKELSSFEELVIRKEQWRHADEHRDFGAPLILGGHGDDHHNGLDYGHGHGHHHHHNHDDGDHACRPPAQRLANA